MKSINRASLYNAKQFVLCLMLLSFTAGSVIAQETKTVIKEGQEYKMKYNEALKLYNAGNLGDALPIFQESLTMANTAGDQTAIGAATKAVFTIHTKLCKKNYDSESFDVAKTHCQEAVSVDPSLASNQLLQSKNLSED